jgi:hypothetical protein
MVLSCHLEYCVYVRSKPGLRLRDRKVERLARKMRGRMPWLEDSDMPAARAWAELEYLCGSVYAEIRNQDADSTGQRARGARTPIAG